MIRGMSCFAFLLLLSLASCAVETAPAPTRTAARTDMARVGPAEILGRPDHLAFAYGGYRTTSREIEPTVEQIKEDLRILSAMGVKLLRTYNTQQYRQAARLLDAIDQLRAQDPSFEMYVMLGAWIECDGAWTEERNHDAGHVDNNAAEIRAAVDLANAHPETVQVIAVGNEAMVHWATYYFVRPAVVRRWVDHLQGLKAAGELPPDVWITSSDNFAAWGGEAAYRNEELEALIQAVDFVSLHTYPFHDTHYHREYWGAPASEDNLTPIARADAAMRRATARAIDQYQAVADYIAGLGIDKPIHIGETGWASRASTTFGYTGSQAADEYKAKLYYDSIRDWTNKAGISCFYFEAFDEAWKDQDPGGSENHFGLITIDGQAKYALWSAVDASVFDGLTRGGRPITKTFDADQDAMWASLLRVPSLNDMGRLGITTVNPRRQAGQKVTERRYVILDESMTPEARPDTTYPSAQLRLNVWESTCRMELGGDGVIHVTTGTGDWWGCSLEIQATKGENLTDFGSGHLHCEIRGDPAAAFDIGFQTGRFLDGNQTNNHVTFAPGGPYELTEDWTAHSIPIADLRPGAHLADVTSLLYLRGTRDETSRGIDIRKISYTRP